MKCSIATWNINSIKSRLDNVIKWISLNNVDIILLQELKCQTDNFPFEQFEEQGYNCYVLGEKTYNGVAILSKYPIEDITYSLPTYNIIDNDTQSRFIEGSLILGKSSIRISSIYVPNGAEPQSDKFNYKLSFLDRLTKYIKTNQDLYNTHIIGGDFNIAPSNVDVYDPISLKDKICFNYKEHQKLQILLQEGLFDIYRMKYPSKQGFSWWDYRGNAFNFNKGYRIDYILASANAVDHLDDIVIDQTPRSWEKPSDHAPVIGYFDFSE